MTRSGADYIRAIRDGRAVYLDGEKVKDVTTHPAFAEVVKTVANLYDIANDPANRELMTFPSPQDGRPVNRCYLIPRTQEDLIARRKAHKRWADAMYGLLGRSPDHVASFFAGFAGSPEFFARGGQQYADNIQRFHARAGDDDLYMAAFALTPFSFSALFLQVVADHEGSCGTLPCRADHLLGAPRPDISRGEDAGHGGLQILAGDDESPLVQLCLTLE